MTSLVRQSGAAGVSPTASITVQFNRDIKESRTVRNEAICRAYFEIAASACYLLAMTDGNRGCCILPIRI